MINKWYLGMDSFSIKWLHRLGKYCDAHHLYFEVKTDFNYGILDKSAIPIEEFKKTKDLFKDPSECHLILKMGVSKNDIEYLCISDDLKKTLIQSLCLNRYDNEIIIQEMFDRIKDEFI